MLINTTFLRTSSIKDEKIKQQLSLWETNKRKKTDKKLVSVSIFDIITLKVSYSVDNFLKRKV